MCYQLWNTGYRGIWLAIWSFIAMLFNPIAEFHLTKENWMVLDFGAGIIFGYVAWKSYKSQKEGHVLTQRDALEAYARMINNLDPKKIETILADDFVYESQMVLTPLNSKSDFLDYIYPKLETIKRTNALVFAEMGNHPDLGRCVILAQDNLNNLQGLVFAEVENDQLKRIDLCIVPPAETAIRSGWYPK